MGLLPQTVSSFDGITSFKEQEGSWDSELKPGPWILLPFFSKLETELVFSVGAAADLILCHCFLSQKDTNFWLCLSSGSEIFGVVYWFWSCKNNKRNE